jgi:exonuclease VII small subunit
MIGLFPLLLHDKLINNHDGSLRLVLEPEIYKNGVELAKSLVLKLYGSENKVDVIR